MHPPFFVVDHKIGPDTDHHSDHKPIVRRTRPERLSLDVSASGWPPVPLQMPAPGQPPALPSGSRVFAPAHLQVVPPPERRIRQVIGRLLIRMGQRMILENRA